MEQKTKEVYFCQYCCLCKHAKVSEADEPCAECLDHPVNEYSHKPIHFTLAKNKTLPTKNCCRRNSHESV